MATDVQWGVLGNATIARKCVIGAIQRSCNGRLRALASRSPENARKVVQHHDIPVLYEDYDDLLADSAITAVYIPLPNHLHRPWTLKSLAAGKHVLCEKPLACDAREAREMAHAAQAARRPFRGCDPYGSPTVSLFSSSTCPWYPAAARWRGSC